MHKPNTTWGREGIKRHSTCSSEERQSAFRALIECAFGIELSNDTTAKFMDLAALTKTRSDFQPDGHHLRKQSRTVDSILDVVLDAVCASDTMFHNFDNIRPKTSACRAGVPVERIFENPVVWKTVQYRCYLECQCAHGVQFHFVGRDCERVASLRRPVEIQCETTETLNLIKEKEMSMNVTKDPKLDSLMKQWSH
eukprot:PhF_6_TR36151/c0_g2_i3/m.52555